MPNSIFKIKRRTSGAAGAPSQLMAGELAYNEIDNTVYIGFGDDGSGNATSIQAVAGAGAFTNLTGAQTVSGAKTFTGAVGLGSQATVSAPNLADTSSLIVSSAWVRGQAYLTANQAITVTGDVTGSGTTSLVLSLPAIVTAGTAPKVTFNAKGQITGSAALSPSDVPTLTHTWISDFDTQVQASRLDQMAAPTATVLMNNQVLTGVATPVQPGDAANKQYVDSAIQGLTPKPTATVATTAALPASVYANGVLGQGATLTASVPGILTIDQYQVQLGDLVVVKDETSTARNGLYVMTTQGTASVAFVLKRHTDMQIAVEFSGAFIPVGAAGQTNANTLWLCNPAGAITVGTTGIPFSRLNAATQVLPGNGVSVSGSTISVVAASSQRLTVSGSGVDLAQGVATPGTYHGVTVDTYGRVTAGTNPTTLSGYAITDAQALNTNLTALAGLTGAANQVAVFTGAGAMTLAAFTAFGQQLVASAGAQAVLTLLGLGTMATQNANAVAITGGTIDNVVIDGGTF